MKTALFALFTLFGAWTLAIADDAPATPAEMKKALEKKLQTIIVPHIEFEDIDLRDALQKVSALSKELSPDGRKVNILLMPPPDKREAKIPISISLDKVPLGEVIRYCAMLGGLAVTIEPHAVVLKPAPPEKKKD